MWRKIMSMALRLISSQEPTLSSDAACASDRILGCRPQLEDGLGDDAERAFGAHEQVL
jgi:hypothetical protein